MMEMLKNMRKVVAGVSVKKSICKLGVIIAVVLVTTTFTSAAWYDYAGLGPADWATAASWNQNSVPGAADQIWEHNKGTMNVTTTEACLDLQLGYNTSGGGTFNISGSGNLTVGNDTYVARDGDPLDVSTLNITSGGNLTSNSGMYLSYYSSGPTSVVNVDGSGSTWTTAGTFDFGRYGSSTINISNSGAVAHTGGTVTMATYAGADVTLSITTGGTLTNSGGDFIIGGGGTGAATVDGAGSSWSSSDNLFVGNYGTATLDITNGGEVSGTGDRVRIGFRAGSSGAVTVSGTDSVLNTNICEVAIDGDATLDISDGGLVTSTDLRISTTAATAVVRMNLDGMLALDGDGSANIAAFLDLVAGSDNIDYWTGSAWDDITNGTEGSDYTLELISGGDLDGYTVLTVLSAQLLAGDANRDGVVSAGDYASVQANFGNTGAAGIPGDANGDGVVSAGDYASVQANFGNTAPAQVTPEPATLTLLVISGLAMIRRRKISL